MSKDVAVETVRKWHLTICRDLCLPVVPVIVKLHGPLGTAGEFFGQRTQSPSGFVGMSFDGIFVGENVGGEVSTTYWVAIYAASNYGEREYLYTLARELRHAWHFLNNVPATVEDANDYAERFLNRFSDPNSGRYAGLVDETEYTANTRQRQLARSGQRRKYFIFAVWVVGLVVLAIGSAMLPDRAYTLDPHASGYKDPAPSWITILVGAGILVLALVLTMWGTSGPKARR